MKKHTWVQRTDTRFTHCQLELNISPQTAVCWWPWPAAALQHAACHSGWPGLWFLVETADTALLSFNRGKIRYLSNINYISQYSLCSTTKTHSFALNNVQSDKKKQSFCFSLCKIKDQNWTFNSDQNQLNARNWCNYVFRTSTQKTMQWEDI